VAELERLELIEPLLVVRQVRPIKGGDISDPHVHFTASVNPADIGKVHEVIEDIFGGDSIWLNFIVRCSDFCRSGHSARFGTSGRSRRVLLRQKVW
jgi:hypothetical protein